MLKAIWVMGDDIEVIQNPHVLSELTDKLDALVGNRGWDVLFTDHDTKSDLPSLRYGLHNA
jgi:hypothetical protein